jgi:hypothetical protein
MTIFFKQDDMTPENRSSIKNIILDTHAYDIETFEENCTFFNEKLKEIFIWFDNLINDRKIALIALCFILGLKNVIEMEKIITYLYQQKFIDAGRELKKLGYEKIANLISCVDLIY